jgi:hypothetical protein
MMLRALAPSVCEPQPRSTAFPFDKPRIRRFMSAGDDTLPVANPEVIFRNVSEGAVLLHTRDEVYFGLNAVGARIWQLLPPVCRTLDDLCAAVAKEYPSVDAGVIRADIVELLEDLAAQRLVQPVDGRVTAATRDGAVD